MEAKIQITFEDNFCIILPIKLINMKHTLEWMIKNYPNAEMEIKYE